MYKIPSSNILCTDYILILHSNGPQLFIIHRNTEQVLVYLTIQITYLFYSNVILAASLNYVVRNLRKANKIAKLIKRNYFPLKRNLKRLKQIY